jgi:hypothetical protein
MKRPRFVVFWTGAYPGTNPSSMILLESVRKPRERLTFDRGSIHVCDRKTGKVSPYPHAQFEA